MIVIAIIAIVGILIVAFNDDGDDNLPPSINNNKSWTGTIDV